MTQRFVFQTTDPAYIRHAGPDREWLSHHYPMAGSQREAEDAQQKRLHVLTKAGKSIGKKLAKKLQACRNDKPCGSVACAHCQRERYLDQLAISLLNMSAGPGYACVELVFSEDATTQHPWLDMTQSRQQICRYKQRISRLLRRLGHTGRVIGAFSLLRLRFNEGEECTFWLPRLRLLVPDNRDLLRELGVHMARGVIESAGIELIIPVRKLPAKDMARSLRLALDSGEYVTASMTNEVTGTLKTGTPELLKGRTLARSLVMLDNMGSGMLTFRCGVLPQKSVAIHG